MRAIRRHAQRSALSAPITSGVFVDGFRVERVIETLADAYTVVEAEGADGERVALTLLAPALARDRTVRRTVLGLARLRASIEHPHLLAFRGAIESGNRVYLVGALPPTRTFRDLLRGGRLNTGDALRLLGQVAGALETAAARGLTHRDLTPGAVFVEKEDAAVLLTDFGIAIPPAPVCELLGHGERVHYRSPEELRGEPPGPESNVYSLASMLVRCLTGTPAYPYDRPLLTLHAHVVEPPPRVSDRRPDLPSAVDDVVAQGMAKAPGERHPSPAHLIRAAAQALGVDVAVPVVPVPPDERKRVRARRRRSYVARGARRTTAWIGVALCASAVSGFAIGGVDWSSRQPPPPAVRPAWPDGLQHFAYTQGVTMAVDRLRERRVVARRRLRRAERPVGQAAAAEALASAYRDARVLLPRPPEGGGEPRLGDELRKAERAYRKLAAAATRRNRRAWRVARADALRREKALRRELRSGQRS
jgi:protein kinase-like protein